MPAQRRSAPAQSLREYGRGVVGGLLVSLPLLYTMEVWWAGFTSTPERLLAGLGATFVLLLLYNRYAGLHEDSCWQEVVIDSIEELGIGLVVSASVLWLIGEIAPATTPEEVIGKIVIEAMAVAIGVSVGTAQFGDAQEGEQGMADDEGDEDGGGPSTLAGLALGFCGAFLVAANVAPTDEIVQIASETPLFRLLLVAAVSFGLCGLTLFFSDFSGSAEHVARDGRKDVLRGSVVTYAVALLAAGFLLWFFGRFDGSTPEHAAALLVVLGFPAALGASAGRLLLQQSSDR